MRAAVITDGSSRWAHKLAPKMRRPKKNVGTLVTRFSGIIWSFDEHQLSRLEQKPEAGKHADKGKNPKNSAILIIDRKSNFGQCLFGVSLQLNLICCCFLK